MNRIVDGFLCCHVGSCFGVAVLYCYVGSLTGGVVVSFCGWIGSCFVVGCIVDCECVGVCCTVMFCNLCFGCCSVGSCCLGCCRVVCDDCIGHCIGHCFGVCVVYCFSVVLELHCVVVVLTHGYCLMCWSVVVDSTLCCRQLSYSVLQPGTGYSRHSECSRIFLPAPTCGYHHIWDWIQVHISLSLIHI